MSDTPVSDAPLGDMSEKKPVRRGRIAAVAGAALLLVAVIGGAGYTAVAVNGADRDPGKPTWTFPKANAKDAKGGKDGKGTEEEAGGLQAVLLPYGTNGYARGPDMAEFGSDAVLSGRQATAIRKESVKDLPRSQRRQLEKEIDKQRIKGMVMRSYLSTPGATDSTLYADEAFTIEIVLSRMESRRAVRDISTYQRAFLDLLDVFRKGPKIEGHKNAECFLPPTDEEEKLDAMYCSAYEGDVLVSATVYGAKKLDEDAVAMFLRDQLDRITDPGEAV
ncbi:hypothetical protein [Streptomyces sp. NPDC050704]|uniref:hypothetical protein n=1 Tax=Streptomyces sp. NPDC050704 TaxID=3157219 RepID=UPI00342632CA